MHEQVYCYLSASFAHDFKMEFSSHVHVYMYHSLTKEGPRVCTLHWAQTGACADIRGINTKYGKWCILCVTSRVCVNQSHHILKVVKRWEFPICNACTRWVHVLSNKFYTSEGNCGKLGDGQTIHSGPFFVTLWYIQCDVDYTTYIQWNL